MSLPLAGTTYEAASVNNCAIGKANWRVLCTTCIPAWAARYKIVNVKERIEKGKRAEGVGGLGEITYKEYFLPIHKEIIAILKTTIHLLEGGIIPPSLLTYIAHFTSENLAWRLSQEKIEIWDFITSFPEGFPDQLTEDVEDEFASGCRGVDCLDDRLEADLTVVECGNRLDRCLTVH